VHARVRRRPSCECTLVWWWLAHVAPRFSNTITVEVEGGDELYLTIYDQTCSLRTSRKCSRATPMPGAAEPGSSPPLSHPACGKQRVGTRAQGAPAPHRWRTPLAPASREAGLQSLAHAPTHLACGRGCAAAAPAAPRGTRTQSATAPCCAAGARARALGPGDARARGAPALLPAVCECVCVHVCACVGVCACGCVFVGLCGMGRNDGWMDGVR